MLKKIHVKLLNKQHKTTHNKPQLTTKYIIHTYYSTTQLELTHDLYDYHLLQIKQVIINTHHVHPITQLTLLLLRLLVRSVWNSLRFVSIARVVHGHRDSWRTRASRTFVCGLEALRRHGSWALDGLREEQLLVHQTRGGYCLDC